jgi:hypothetical protein
MRKTVADVLKQIAGTVNQEATAPTVGSDEYNLWLEYLNRAQDEWAQAYDWEASRKHFWPGVTGVSQASISLPEQFNKLAAPVLLYGNGSDKPTQYSYVLDEDENMYSSTDTYVKITGDNAAGKTLVFNPRTLSSGASLYIQYFANPSTLSSLTQYMAMDDPQYAIDRTIAYIFESRSDPRFQIEETKSRERLLNMIENANDAKFNSYAAQSYVPNTLRRNGFRIGLN